MPNHFNIPYITPFKFVRVSKTPGIHFDDAWACEQVKTFERRAYYYQKWQRADITKIQIESTIQPMALAVYNSFGVVVTTFPWTIAFNAISYSIYETTIDFSALPDDIYFLYQRNTLLSINWEAISEPIHVKTNWPGTIYFKYKHSFNDYDVAWTTGIEMLFRVEAVLPPTGIILGSERTAHVSQTEDTETLQGIPSRGGTLYIGGTGYDKGVPPWVMDLLNRIFLCDSINIQGAYFQPGSDAKWEKTVLKGWPFVSGSIEIWPAHNAMSLEFADAGALAPGIVTAYDIETILFNGQRVLIPIIDVEQEG